MANSKHRSNRRDRRKAKQSNFRREGTKNPKKVGHHSGHGLGRTSARTKAQSALVASPMRKSVLSQREDFEAVEALPLEGVLLRLKRSVAE